MPNLERVIRELSLNLARDILQALKHASLDELVAERGPSANARARMSAGAAAPRHRRSDAEIEKLTEKIVGVVRAHAQGISAEELKAILKLPSGRASQKIIARPIALALASKRVRKRGTRRATRYFRA